MYEDEALKDYYTLMDIAYIYTWRRVSTNDFNSFSITAVNIDVSFDCISFIAGSERTAALKVSSSSHL